MRQVAGRLPTRGSGQVAGAGVGVAMSIIRLIEACRHQYSTEMEIERERGERVPRAEVGQQEEASRRDTNYRVGD